MLHDRERLSGAIFKLPFFERRERADRFNAGPVTIAAEAPRQSAFAALSCLARYVTLWIVPAMLLGIGRSDSSPGRPRAVRLDRDATEMIKLGSCRRQ